MNRTLKTATRHAAAGPPSQRCQRVAEELRHVLAHVFEKGELRDPALAGVPVTLTEVRVGADLRNATVFVVPFGGGDPDRLLEGLTRAAPYLRRCLAERVRLKFIPALSFRFDDSFDRAQSLNELLRRECEPRDPDEDDRPGAAAP